MDRDLKHTCIALRGDARRCSMRREPGGIREIHTPPSSSCASTRPIRRYPVQIQDVHVRTYVHIRIRWTSRVSNRSNQKPTLQASLHLAGYHFVSCPLKCRYVQTYICTGPDQPTQSSLHGTFAGRRRPEDQ